MTDLNFVKPLIIGKVKLENNIALAPMAGTTDITYRQICRHFGAGFTVTELVSARGIVYDPELKRNYRFLEISPEENPVSIQLFGSDPQDFSIAINRILKHPILSQCAMIDINMGCPVAKVVKQGAGSALMCNPALAGEIVGRSVEAAAEYDKPVTVKIRAGWDDQSINCAEIARVCEKNGAAAITVHARTRAQMYNGKANWEYITDVKKSVNIPVFGNGDINSVDAARQMIQQTNSDGIMIGRAAQGNPWFFSSFLTQKTEKNAAELITNLEQKPDKDVRMYWIIKHLDGMIDRLGESTAIKEMRPHLAHYFKNTRNATTFRRQIMTARTRAELISILEEWRIY